MYSFVLQSERECRCSGNGYIERDKLYNRQEIKATMTKNLRYGRSNDDYGSRSSFRFDIA